MVEKLRENVFSITVNLGSNNSAILTAEGVVLFDTPLKPTDALSWRKFVDSLGPTKYIIISDHHIDHTLTNAFFDGSLISHELTRSKLQNSAPSMEFMSDLLFHIDPYGEQYIHGGYAYRIPDVTIAHDCTLTMGDTVIELFCKKGHTENSLMAYLPKEKVLFTGDNVCENSLPCLDQTCLPEVYETLNFIMNDLDVETIVPGHGAVCTKKEALRFKHWLESVYESVEKEYRNGLTKDEVIAKLSFPDLIHCDTDQYRGYPQSHIDGFQIRSYAHVYDVVAGMAMRK